MVYVTFTYTYYKCLSVVITQLIHCPNAKCFKDQ